MIKYVLLMILVTLPAFADEAYQAGYNSGYYNSGPQVYGEINEYGRGYQDGIDDSEQDDDAARDRDRLAREEISQEQDADEAGIAK